MPSFLLVNIAHSWKVEIAMRSTRGDHAQGGVNHLKNLQQPDHRNLCFLEHRAWLPRHISDHGWNRMRSESPTHRRLHLVQFSSMPLH
jgi:hypothetical protein